jgi:hypothetical protein
MVLEYLDINNLLDFKNPIHLYGFIAAIIGLMYILHTDLGILEEHCYIIKGPNPNLIKDKVYQYDKQCYQFNPYVSGCKKNNSVKSDSLLI